MNSINNYKQGYNGQFKGAIIEYTCFDCCFGDNFFIELNGISRVKPGSCDHFDINFLLTSERNAMKLVASFNCKNCHKNNMLELFNTQNKQNSGSITYKCIGCGSGNLTAGYLFQNEEIKIDNVPGQKIIFQNNNLNQNKNIKLIFLYNNKEYKIDGDPELSIPEVFHKLTEKNNELQNVDIRSYKKDGNSLSPYKTIKELNLKDGDKIEIVLRPKQTW